jgi:hypothetical protein
MVQNESHLVSNYSEQIAILERRGHGVVSAASLVVSASAWTCLAKPSGVQNPDLPPNSNFILYCRNGHI